MSKVTLAEVLPVRRGKLTEEEVREIRSLFAQGAAKSRLAAAFGVSRITVRSIVNRKTWAHLPEEG